MSRFSTESSRPLAQATFSRIGEVTEAELMRTLEK